MASDKKDIPACFDRPEQTAARLKEMFVEIAQRRRIETGPRPAERAVFRKLHGVAHGKLVVNPKIDRSLKVGVFAKTGPLETWVRFSSDTAPTAPDLKSTLGIGIKVFGIEGRNALGEIGDTADFIMQNHPVFFVNNAREMVEFTYAGVVLGDYPGYLAKHPKVAEILDAMAKIEGSALTATYWGILPFKAGEHIVKYRLWPTAKPENVANADPNYLALDLAARLSRGEYSFDFQVQLRTDPEKMPLDMASVPWPKPEGSESEKSRASRESWTKVATLTLPKQDVNSRGQADYGQSLAFNIFRVPEQQAPVEQSSIAQVRKVVYAASADARHQANGEPLADNPTPRKAESRPLPKDDCIVKAVIYPSIGIARIGSSDEYFVGPETPDPKPPAHPDKVYRDGDHALKRQAARFHIYGVNARGEIVRELTGADDTKIEWTVRLANTKAAWYGFQLAMDIPEAASAPPTTLRNASVTDRSLLSIRPSAQHVSGRNARPKKFDDGKFINDRPEQPKQIPVYLGEIFTDASGCLLVLGGKGVSNSYNGSWAITFANNEGWYDDTSDGPVTATVKLGGSDLEVVPSWVVVAPPNYGPQQKSVRTMWDLMRDVAITAGMLPAPREPSFTRDILPIFQRLNGLQWVNAGFAAGWGFGGTFDITTPEGIAKLNDRSLANQEWRRTMAKQFRHFDVDSWSPKPWPWLYGDAMSIPPAPTPRQYCTLSDCQLAMLDQWGEGEFAADYDPSYTPPATLDEVPLAEQGDTLTKAALDFCLADAFHPGCEMTWPVRAKTMYMAPFRFLHAPDGWIEPTFGEVLTSDNLTIPDGPLYGQLPGSITRWMAVPWQCDTASCRSGYEPAYDPYVPSFWPARVPNQVLTKENYAIVMDRKRPLSERKAAFANRAAWIAPLGNTSYTDQINNMIDHFDHLGVVISVPGPGDAAFPARIEIEDLHVPIDDVMRPGPKPNIRGKARRGLLAAPAAAGTTMSFRSLGRGAGGQSGAPGVYRPIDISGIDKFRRFPNGLAVRFR
ncbi:MAG TPA: LodA/GoxA family CTQ-dependent oxidase [Xanthobacteraceae bacterium]|nr:LodA/GoxA family CTQ-dependent oxidase [Xanthobacteraceae bacterium]